MPTPCIRPATDDDLAALERIYQQVRREIGSATGAGFVADTLGEQVLVAEADGLPVGFVALYAPDAFVHHLYVAADWRGRGLGAALLTAATAALGPRAWLKVDAPNAAARAFYRRLGWREEPALEGVVVVRAPPAELDPRAPA